MAPQQGRSGRGWGEWLAVRDKRDSGPKLPLSKAETTITGVCKGSTSTAAQTSVCARLPQLTPLYKLRACTCHSCSSTASLWGKGASAERGESTHLKQTEPTWTQPSGFQLQQLWIRSQLPEGSDSHWAEGKPHLKLGLDIVPPSQPHLLPRWELPAHLKERNELCSCQIQLSHQRY